MERKAIWFTTLSKPQRGLSNTSSAIGLQQICHQFHVRSQLYGKRHGTSTVGSWAQDIRRNTTNMFSVYQTPGSEDTSIYDTLVAKNKSLHHSNTHFSAAVRIMLFKTI